VSPSGVHEDQGRARDALNPPPPTSWATSQASRSTGISGPHLEATLPHAVRQVTFTRGADRDHAGDLRCRRGRADREKPAEARPAKSDPPLVDAVLDLQQVHHRDHRVDGRTGHLGLGVAMPGQVEGGARPSRRRSPGARSRRGSPFASRRRGTDHDGGPRWRVGREPERIRPGRCAGRRARECGGGAFSTPQSSLLIRSAHIRPPACRACRQNWRSP